jgi:hypothetical protein
MRSPLIHDQANIINHWPPSLMHLPANGNLVRHNGL